MEKILVKRNSETEFRVSVNSRINTEHQVTLTPTYYQKICEGKLEPELLIEKSFEFLLEREPNTSILRNFELSLIGHYFPEYERTIVTYF